MGRITFFGIISYCVFLYSCAPQSSQRGIYTANEIKIETKKVNVFFDSVFDAIVARNPILESNLGIKDHYGDWTDISENYQAEINEIVKNNLNALKKRFDYNKLDDQGKVSYKIFVYNSEEQLQKYAFRHLSLPVNQEDGLHTLVPTFLINVHQISTLSDAEAYISRLNKVAPLFEELINQLEIRDKKGIRAPKFVYQKVLSACENVIKGLPFDSSGTNSILLEDFTTKLNEVKDLDHSQKQALISKANNALLTSVMPAYQKLVKYLVEQEKRSTDVVGAWSWPGGDNYYKVAIKHTTTSHLTPQEVFDLGQKEVARIHEEIRLIMKKIKWKGDNVTEFMRSVTVDPKFFYANNDDGRKAYLKQNTDYIEIMKQSLEKLFLTKPKADIQVRAVEKFREKSAGTAFYEQPAPDGSRPGYFYVNLYDMSQAPIYQIEALAYHEGIPGHHMQISIAQEMTQLPKFRRFGEHTAYIEGWALYSELIPKEIGFYTDPYQDFGRLSMELLRAARLVVDPGIHYKKWSREQAIKYFLENTAEPALEVENAINRYIVWPSQATAYKVGMNKILELRKKAKIELGDKFDIREFHDVVLTSGSVPLAILDENITNWIKFKKMN